MARLRAPRIPAVATSAALRRPADGDMRCFAWRRSIGEGGRDRQ
jgi:hypothetical protein